MTEQATLTVQGRQFRVEQVEGSTLDEGLCAYVLHGSRGARYRTMRNKPRPHMMFLINDKAWTRHAPEVWLTDRDGTLCVVR